MDDDSENPTRIKIRQKLSSMSVEELQKLKAKVGIKEYEATLGLKKNTTSIKNYTRDNKNRPREMSSKKTVSRARRVVETSIEQQRDPRFDSACGEYNEKIFKDSYRFVDKIKQEEYTYLKKRLATETDEDEIKKLKYLIQRCDNQKREKLSLENKRSRKPGGDCKEILNTYESLKKSGRLDKYMRNKEKKLAFRKRNKFL